MVQDVSSQTSSIYIIFCHVSIIASLFHYCCIIVPILFHHASFMFQSCLHHLPIVFPCSVFFSPCVRPLLITVHHCQFIFTPYSTMSSSMHYVPISSIMKIPSFSINDSIIIHFSQNLPMLSSICSVPSVSIYLSLHISTFFPSFIPRPSHPRHLGFGAHLKGQGQVHEGGDLSVEKIAGNGGINGWCLMDMVVSWNRGTHSHHPFLDGFFHEITQPAIGILPFVETPIYILDHSPYMSAFSTSLFHVFLYPMDWRERDMFTGNHDLHGKWPRVLPKYDILFWFTGKKITSWNQKESNICLVFYPGAISVGKYDDIGEWPLGWSSWFNHDHPSPDSLRFPKQQRSIAWESSQKNGQIVSTYWFRTFGEILAKLRFRKNDI